MSTCIVTGGAGFIGSHLTEKLVVKGWRVIVVDNLSSGTLRNLEKVKKDIEFLRIDIRDKERLNKIRIKADVIVHLAALVSVSESILKPKETFDTNFTGTINILETAKRLGIKKIIFASSSAVYGNINNKKIKESNKVNSISPYGLSKSVSEQVLNIYSNLYEITTISLRFFNVYGKRQNGNSPYSGVISKFIQRIKDNEKPIIYGSGEQTRDFIYIEDIVSAILASIKIKRGNNIFNVATGITTSINELLEIFLKITGRNIKAIYRPSRKGDILFSGGDNNKISCELNFKPKYTIYEGLKNLIKESF